MGGSPALCKVIYNRQYGASDDRGRKAQHAARPRPGRAEEPGCGNGPAFLPRRADFRRAVPAEAGLAGAGFHAARGAATPSHGSRLGHGLATDREPVRGPRRYGTLPDRVLRRSDRGDGLDAGRRWRGSGRRQRCGRERAAERALLGPGHRLRLQPDRLCRRLPVLPDRLPGCSPQPHRRRDRGTGRLRASGQGGFAAPGPGEPRVHGDGRALSELRQHSEGGPVTGRGRRHSGVADDAFTAGVVPRIFDFGQEAVRPKLAISLNAPNDELRSRIMPINRKWNLGMLLEAARAFPLRLRERLTFEYVLLDGVNDAVAQAREVAERIRGIRAKVNLIALNPGPGIAFATPPPQRVLAFQQVLTGAGIPTFIRRPRGRDIYAACGQLKRMVESEFVALTVDPAEEAG